MSVCRIEALADAIMQHEGWFPGSRSYSNRNPGNLRWSSVPHTMDWVGFCVFDGLINGYDALIADLTGKCLGHTVTGLGPDSTLRDLIYVWAPPSDGNDTVLYVERVLEFMTRALNETITADTKLRDLHPVI